MEMYFSGKLLQGKSIVYTIFADFGNSLPIFGHFWSLLLFSVQLQFTLWGIFWPFLRYVWILLGFPWAPPQLFADFGAILAIFAFAVLAASRLKALTCHGESQRPPRQDQTLHGGNFP